MTAWTSYKYLPSYSSILPRAFSTPCEDFRINESLPCREDNYPCRASAAWNGLGPECVKGRYVPPQCLGEKAKYCQEVYAPDPEWDLGFFEGLINNTGLNFTMVYMGVSEMPFYLLSLLDAGRDFVFQWSVPDPVV